MTILEKGNFRLQTISTVKDSNLPISYGINIEKKCESYDSYYVISTIKYNSHEELAGIVDDVDGRLLDVDSSEWDLFKKLYSVAKQLLEVACAKID